MVRYLEKVMKASILEAAETALRRTGARITTPRIQVLSLLLREGRALTHLEIEDKLRRSGGIDRVTIYRVLDWLVKNGLAHRVAMGERAWRFDAIDPEHTHGHAHFQCGSCGVVTCLDELQEMPQVKLPEGFHSEAVELTVKGACPKCAPRLKSDRAVQPG